MCLILFAHQVHPSYRLIFAANRDEFYDRPTAPMAFWDEAPDVLGGRDLKEGGAWFGVTRSGQWAAITNFRDPARTRPAAPSRGLIVSRFLLGDLSPGQYMETLVREAGSYNGFNLLVGDATSVYYFSNRGHALTVVSPGIYGLSNRFLDTPWPKVAKGKEALADVIAKGAFDVQDLFAVLEDRDQANEADLPNTGVGKEWEKLLSGRFISSSCYGTRSSTVLLIDYQNRVSVREKIFDCESHPIEERAFEFEVSG